MSATKGQISYLETLEGIALDVIRPAAPEIDQSGSFPREAVDALSKDELLGLPVEHTGKLSPTMESSDDRQ